MFFHDDYYQMLDDYIDTAPAGSNEAVAKPRYHGNPGTFHYYDQKTKTACACGYCLKDLFARQITKDDPDCKYL